MSEEIKDAVLAMANKEANLLEYLIQKTMLAYGCEVTDLCLHRKIISDGMEFSVVKKAESDARYPDIGMHIASYKHQLIEACEMWCNDRRTEIVYGGLDKDALRLLEFIKTWEPGEK